MNETHASEGAAKTPGQAIRERWFPRHPFGGREIYANAESNEPIATFESQFDCERAITCVNALEGIANPAAVKQLVQKVRALILTWEHEDDPVPSIMQNAYLREIRNLLAALDAPVPKTEEIS